MPENPEPLSQDICRDFIQRNLFAPKAGSFKTGSSPGLIGVELEAFPVSFSDHEKTKAVPVSLIRSSAALVEVLKGYPMDRDYEKDALSEINLPNGASFQYEPGGQIEIVTQPCPSLSELIAQLDFQQDILDQLTENHQIHFAQIGTNPWFSSDQIGLQLDKPRYRALQKYFYEIGPFGIQMMRQTCSLHINLDWGASESTQVKRFLAANLLVPFATAIFANSGILEGKLTGCKSYRSSIWQQLDSKRRGIKKTKKTSGLPGKESLIDAYMDFVMQAPIIHIKTLGDRVFPINFTLDHWLKNPIEGISPSQDDFENHLSLLYPEVRPKGFLEIRTVDALPREWQLAPAYFYTGLLYSEKSLDKMLDLLLPLVDDIDGLYREASFGFESTQILGISKQLMNLAIEGFSDLPKEFAGCNPIGNLIAFHEKYTTQRKTVADETIANFSKDKPLIY
jgi:glutamate--cysteine ligase